MVACRFKWILFGVFGFACLAPVSVRAQVDLNTRFSGYYEHQYSLSRTGGNWKQLDYDRLRGEIDVRTRQGSRASAGMIFQLYRGDTRIDPSDYLPSGILLGPDSLGSSLSDRHYLNHAYMVLSASRWLEITVGKQYLTWGASWVFNPTELFRPKNSLEPSYDREGVGAISATITLGALSDLLIAFIPDGSLESSGKVVRLRHHISGFDVSGIAALRSDPGAVDSSFDPERRYIIGGDITGEVLGLGLWSEGTWSHQDKQQWAELTVGGNYTLADRTLLMAEVFINGRGKVEGPYSAQAWLERLSGERRTLGRTTIFGMISRPIGDLWTFGISSIANPGDGSFLMIPSIAYSFAENIDLLFNAVWYVGEAGEEYGFDQTGGFLRGRLYF